MLRLHLRIALLVLLLPAGCGNRGVTVVEGPGDTVGYSDSTDVVVTGPRSWVVSGDPDGCVMVEDRCLDLNAIKEQYCKSTDAQADIVVIDGKVQSVICYPPLSGGVAIDTVGTTQDGTTAVPQNANNTVITFGAETDGKPVGSNVVLNAENISIIGNGIDKTIIAGDLTLDSNNAHVRGLTVTGNLILDKNSNGATVGFVKVQGNLVIRSNNVVAINSIVFGNVEVLGQSVTLINLAVAGNLAFLEGGTALLCEGNQAFADASGNGLVEPAELGAALTCAPK